MECVVFGICLACGDYERYCVSCELVDNREEIVFLLSGLHRVTFALPRRVSLPFLRGKTEGLRQTVTVLSVAGHCQK